MVRKEFAEQNKEALDQFLTEYQSSVEYVNANVTEASELIAAQGIIPKAAVAAKALPNCNICYIDGEQMKTQLSGFLKVLYEANPNSVGGNLPDENFYYQK